MEQVPPRAILAFGAERRGLSSELMASADHRISIPMSAGVSSLNVATAVAVVLYKWNLVPKEQSQSHRREVNTSCRATPRFKVRVYFVGQDI